MDKLTQTLGVGVADLQRAALSEARRVARDSRGDRRVATELVFDQLRELGWISDEERDVLTKMFEIGAEKAGVQARRLEDGRPDATAAYLQVRRMYDELLLKGDAGAVALTLAAGATGSYEAVAEGDGTSVAYAKSDRNYQAVLGGAGAIIGGAIGGAEGAAIGGAIGTIVDDCKD